MAAERPEYRVARQPDEIADVLHASAQPAPPAGLNTALIKEPPPVIKATFQALAMLVLFHGVLGYFFFATVPWTLVWVVAALFGVTAGYAVAYRLRSTNIWAGLFGASLGLF